MSKIEKGQRQVGLDELIPLALALGVSPLRLLLPPHGEDEVELAEVDGEAVAVPWQHVWRWATGEQPLDHPALPPAFERHPAQFVHDNRPFEGTTANELARWMAARSVPPFHARVFAEEGGQPRAWIRYGSGSGELDEDEAELFRMAGDEEDVDDGR